MRFFAKGRNHMKFIDYIKAVPKYPAMKPEDFRARIKINLITNFTDEILKNLLIGVGLYQGIYPSVRTMPYKQYHVRLKNDRDELYEHEPDITFVLFHASPLKDSEFRSRQHFEEVLIDIERYAEKVSGTVVISAFPISYHGAYGNLFHEGPLLKLVSEYNERLQALAKRLPNGMWFDTNRLVHRIGEAHAFDARSLYAFDVPFTHEFMTVLAEDWLAHARALLGESKKVIVLDLDNTLWGGIVGELGSEGIALGPDYPGNAFVNFQRALLDFYERGIILAVVSKNNLEDAMGAFEKNPYMVLTEKHFSAIRANWNDKADNIIDIAKELNVGTDSMVFIDDDPVSRFAVKSRLPEVIVPDFSLPPEEYARTLYEMDWFHQLSLTDEDRQKGKMYAEERQRKTVANVAKDMKEYIAELGMVILFRINSEDSIPRISQLALKTNQYNLTTKRYTEADIRKLVEGGALIFSANVSDKFGDYGMVMLAIVTPGSEKGEMVLDSFLMSCRVMGRGVECRFIDAVIRELVRRGITKLHASFVSTAKNKPAETFLPDHGFKMATVAADSSYELDIPAYLKHPCKKVNKAIKIEQWKSLNRSSLPSSESPPKK